ncbi:hypothetical protein [Streptomyces sp. 8N616]|uniref:hypothetical protein n=1 Tax=Streptomyces sp. 8N616 TaxID=3457414 RepID=UPI003FD60619
MPTPYGSRGAMAFSADELRVLRRALAIALRPSPAPPAAHREEEVQELCRLTEAVEEAVREGGRLRAFLLADLARYRAALPGAAHGYLERLVDALSAGYTPGADDLAALRSLCAAPAAKAKPEAERRRVLLRRCEALAEQALRNRLACRTRPAAPTAPRASTAPTASAVSASTAPAASTEATAHPAGRLVALPGGRAADEPAKPAPKPAPKPKAKPGPESKPEPKPEQKPEQKPAAKPKPEPDRSPPPPSEQPGRHVPTPAEVFPPRRRRTPPPGEPSRPEQLVAV